MNTLIPIVAGWILSIMLVLAPPGRETFIMLKEAGESKAQAMERYEQIANELGRVVIEETPLNGSRAFTAALLVSLTFHESAGWRRDVDLGIARLKLARTGWQDHGRSWCLGQWNGGLKVAADGQPQSVLTTPEGWTGPDLVADRHKCLITTLNAAKRSFASCATLPLDKKLSVYAAGICGSEDGQRKSERRVKFAKVLLGRHPFPELPKTPPPEAKAPGMAETPRRSRPLVGGLDLVVPVGVDYD